MKGMTKKLRQAKTWQERLDIAADKLPGTPFDFLFREASRAKNFMAWKAEGNAHQCLKEIGAWLAHTILAGDSQKLHDAASALAEWKRHKPKPDYDLIALFAGGGMFPPGWEKYWRLSKIPRDTRTAIAMRDVRKNLERMDPNFDPDKWESHRRKIQRYAKQFKIHLDDTPGKPSKTSRHNRRKKAR